MSPFTFSNRADVEAVHRAELPVGIKSTEALLDTLSAALCFPDYFGKNWNALDECITDLSWLPPGDVILIHKDVPLVDDRASLLIYLSILHDAVENWKTKGSNLIFASPEKRDTTGEYRSLAKRKFLVFFPSHTQNLVQSELSKGKSFTPVSIKGDCVIASRPATNTGSSLTLDAMSTTTALSPKLYFSYSQFMVYDQSVQLPGCAWTEEHSAQGFARRESTVNFNTPLEFGHADVAVNRSPYQPSSEYERVIAVPFRVASGTVLVEGPDEMDVDRSFTLPPGNYRLVAAQRITGDEDEVIDLFFEPLAKPLEQSAVLVADDALNPPTPLLETAGVAGEA